MANKKFGVKSSAQDNFLEPLNVTSLSATDVGTSRAYSTTFNGTAGQGGAVSLSWTLPATSPAATSYDIKATKISGPGAAANTTVTINTGSATASYTFQGLESNGVYTFTIIPKNASGSAKTPNTVSGNTTVTTVPQAPQSPTATAGVNQNTISWTIGNNGGKALTKHDVTGSDGTSSLNLSAAATSTTIADTAGTSQTYTIVATNANGASLGATTGSVTTLAPYFPPFFPPFFPPYFPPFFPPHFPPFFPPFFPPYFPPFFPPHFPPFFPPFFPAGPFFPPYFASCIDEDTLVAVVGENDEMVYKPAKEIKLGDKVWSIKWDGLGDERNVDPYTWSAESLENISLTQTEIVNIIPSVKDITLTINGEISKRFSLEQTVLLKRSGKFFFGTTGTLELGDILIEKTDSGEFVEIEIKSLETIDEQRTVYQYDAEPGDILIAGNLVVHNAKGFA